jgi:hypothetical protein
MLWNKNDSILRNNTCVLKQSSVLSFRVVPLRNPDLYQISNSRKLSSEVRFSLPLAIFIGTDIPVAVAFAIRCKTGWSIWLFCSSNMI